MNLKWLKIKAKVKGLFADPIPYTPLLENGDSSPYFGTYEGQKIGYYDTSLCWDFSGAEVAETRLEMYWKMNLIPKETMDWLQKNGYIDAQGDFYLSRRWIGILSGVRTNGNDQLNFWKIAGVSGLIPNSMLPYDHNQALKFQSEISFDNDYFNPNVITPAMKAMGQEFLKRFKIQAENVQGGYVNNISSTILTYLKEGSLQIGIPVPQGLAVTSWNNVNIPYPAPRTIADHAVEFYKYDSTQDYPIFIYDTYEPHLKQLAKNYYIPFITRISITPIQTIAPIIQPQFNSWMKFWFNVKAFFTGQLSPYPNVPIGGINKV